MERYFRGKKLIDREENIKFFIDWFERLPELILWVYGLNRVVKHCLKISI